MRNNEDRFNPAVPAQQAPVDGLHYVAPTEVVDLPSKGKFYPQGHPLHEKDYIEIKHMTTKEEDILSSTSLIEKGLVLDYLLKSIIIDKQIDPKTLLPGDQNAILINARINAYGKDYSFNYNCNVCGKTNTHEHDLEQVKNKELPNEEMLNNGLIMITLEKSNLQVSLKQLNPYDIEAMEKAKKKNESIGIGRGPTTSLLLSIVHSIGDQVNDGGMKFVSLIESLPSKDVRYIKKVYADTKPDIDFSFEMDCSSCGNKREGNVPITSTFFWPDA